MDIASDHSMTDSMSGPRFSTLLNLHKDSIKIYYSSKIGSKDVSDLTQIFNIATLFVKLIYLQSIYSLQNKQCIQPENKSAENQS